MKLFLHSKSNGLFPIIAMLLFFVTVFMPDRACSHGGHAHPPVLSDIKAIEKATKDVSIIVDQSELVEGKKLDDGWKQIAAGDKHIHKKIENFFIVSFKKSKEETLYIFLTIYGRYLGANFSGKIEVK